MKFSVVLSKLLSGRNLSETDSKKIFTDLFRNRLKKPEAKALLLLLAKKGESEDEILGGLEAIRSLEPPVAVAIPNLMDTCGTGGDGSHSLNVSTLAAIVIAGAGGKVAKHGNRALSSQCGSSDLIESLGVNLAAPRKMMIESIRRFGIGYFHAPFYHPIFSRVQPLRRELKTRTLFNYMGPLLNPLKVECQLIGVADPNLLPIFSKILQKRKMKRALICHSQEGMDEISSSRPSQVAFLHRGRIIHGKIHPKRYGFRRVSLSAFSGASPVKNRQQALRFLKGKLRGPLRDLVLINSAAGLVIAGKAKTLREGLVLAERSITSGRAYRALLGLKRLSQGRNKA